MKTPTLISQVGNPAGRCACAFAAAAATLLVTNFAQGTIIYSVNANTNFGANTANAGTGATLTDNGDGAFSLAHATNSGANNAAFIDSGDNTATTINGWTNAALGRDLGTNDVVRVSGTVAPAVDYNPIANGFEFGIQSAQGFRSQPNILFQIRARNTSDANSQSGLAPFFDYVANGAGANSRSNDAGEVLEASSADGFSFTATYTESLITYRVSDIEMAGDGATSLTYVFDPNADATSSGATSGFDFLEDVGNGFAYYSQQKQGGGAFPMVIRSFQIEVVPEPTTLALLGLGVVGLGLRRRQKS